MKINNDLVHKILMDLANKGIELKQIEATKRKIIVQAYYDDNDNNIRYYIEMFYNRKGSPIYYRKWTNEYLKGKENESC